ncbi:ankyrin repeat family protein [Turkeypox virus]|uniref:Ankyrin repeat family protein n=1 Tax=Turkeypox virus TaxID=336486 RepID=A0A0M3ZHP2_9POXV|nr:ankyrin repeat family protein [Turkeypox virus]ALA62535.1 ankyrin repeat family protein [Turkeypox virus]
MSLEVYNAIRIGDVEDVIKNIRYSMNNINVIDDALLSPLHYAVECGNKDIVMVILEHGADINLHAEYIESPIHTAVKSGNVEIVKLLIDNGADIDSIHDCRSLTPLQYAIINNDYEITKVLLDANADTDNIYTATYPLMDAIRIGDLDMVKLLLDHGVRTDILESGISYPIGLAISRGNIDIVKLLLDHDIGCDDNIMHRCYDNLLPPIHKAVYSNNLEIVELLLRYKIDINSRDYNNNTPMHIAVQENHRDLVKLLLDYSPDLSIINNDSFTPLKYCDTLGGNDSIIRMIIARIVLNKYRMVVSCSNIIGNEYNWYIIETNKVFREYSTECEKELELMRDIKVGKSSLLDICVSGSANNNMLRFRDTYNYDTKLYKLNIYSDLVSKAIKIAEYRNGLIASSFEVLESLLSTEIHSRMWNVLPKELKYMILQYLENKDLCLIIEST